MSKVKEENSKKKVVKETKVKKKGIFSKIKGYFKGVKKEISRIRWTKKKDMIPYTVATVGFILFFCLYFSAILMLVAFLRSKL